MPAASGTQHDPAPDSPAPDHEPTAPAAASAAAAPAPIRSSLRNVNISAGRGGSCG